MDWRLNVTTMAVLGALAIPMPTARLGPAAAQAFQKYITTVETGIAKRHESAATYLATFEKAAAAKAETERQLRAGSALTEPVNGGTWQIKGGLLHHWRGAAFVAGAKAADMLALLRDYQGLAKYYTPEVQQCKVLANEGDTARIFMRLMKQKVNTVVFDAEFNIKTGLTDATSGYEISRSAHIWQVDNPGTPGEHRMPEGKDDGLLWRLNTFWSFVEVHGGLVMECEAVSLTRDIPFGAGWLVTPIISELPRESLEATLTETKRALHARATRGSENE